VAVAAFMQDEIAFTAIVDTIEKVVDKLSVSAPSRIRDISDVSAIEKDARMYAKEVLKKG
jgi:1-deoxy-D-xylulose-5-phosphate reductoisomerase